MVKNLFQKIQVSRGFSLIELLVVIGIIGILSSVMIANFIGIRERNRDAKRKAEVKQIQTAMELFRTDVGMYPAVLPACYAPLANGSVTYMQEVPCDPLNTTTKYIYAPSGDRFTYTLSACIENENDSDRDVITVPTGTCSSGKAYVVNNP